MSIVKGQSSKVESKSILRSHAGDAVGSTDQNTEETACGVAGSAQRLLEEDGSGHVNGSGRAGIEPPSLFRSFWMGGVECSTQINAAGKRVDMTSVLRHD